MDISDKGLHLIGKFEGCVLHVYNDAVRTPEYPKGHATIGYGHLLHKGAFTPEDPQTITQEEAERILREDAARFVKCVNDHVRVPLTQNQFDACVSLAFNIGEGDEVAGKGFAGSSLVKYLNSGGKDPAEIRRLFCLWQNPKILLPRRNAEATLFLTPDK